MGVRLPSAYQEVEYIEGTGTQWFNVGIYPDANTWVHAKLYTISTGNKNWFGAQYGVSKSFCFNSYSSNQIEYTYGSQAWTRVNYSEAVGAILDLYFAKDSQITINGTVAVSNLPEISGTSELPLYIFKRGQGNAPVSGRLYLFDVYSGNDLVCSLIPCYRKSDDKSGMYDLVSGTFFTNQGTGEFLVGADVIDSISPWMVARRRSMMRKPLVDTSPKISTYEKRLYGVSGTTNSASCCITEFYDVETIPTVQGRIVLGTPAVGAQSNFQCWNDSGAINYAEKAYPYLYVGTTRIRFTLLIDNIDDSYAYNPDDGQIWFAGKNTIYYGYTNINDIPTGT